MDKIIKYFQQENFAKNSGMSLTEVSGGYAKVKMEIEKRHLNVLGTVHGGAIFTLADMAFAAASNSHGTVAVAINCDISFVKAVGEGHLIAEAKETSINPKISTYVVNVTNEKGDTIAIFNGMAYRKKYALELLE
ncbi:PaaI family thioesterase [Methanolobus halotolerans]|uniref:Phenylacetic acid degradation protein n=1 Tax=Methanolobus halotolerans TaxID=2052935 RepID=A0A4E0Q5F1_9EURY|nr:PaaI family thioesterase [Methanolobus halotolerans]TGC09400.1 phenylacetic acid degradation protein [Methanolobus halotolerans]